MRISYRLSLMRWRAREAMKRVGRAVRYATNSISEDDAQQIIYDCQPTSGWYPIETFSVETVLEQAADRWGDNPALPALAAEACRRVWNKWDGTQHASDAAEEWAMDLIEEYAAADGVVLVDSWVPEAAE